MVKVAELDTAFHISGEEKEFLPIDRLDKNHLNNKANFKMATNSGNSADEESQVIVDKTTNPQTNSTSDTSCAPQELSDIEPDNSFHPSNENEHSAIETSQTIDTEPIVNDDVNVIPVTGDVPSDQAGDSGVIPTPTGGSVDMSNISNTIKLNNNINNGGAYGKLENKVEINSHKYVASQHYHQMGYVANGTHQQVMHNPHQQQIHPHHHSLTPTVHSHHQMHPPAGQMSAMGPVLPPQPPWPIEAVIQFGPGFERLLYCPTHHAQGHEHIIWFHVGPGVNVAFPVGTNQEIIRGPAALPMISLNGPAQPPMPVQIPPNHIMQQVVDESGTLRHVFLSATATQPTPVSSATLGNLTNLHSPHYHTNYQNLMQAPNFYPPPPPPANSMHEWLVGSAQMPAQNLNHTMHSQTTPTNSLYHKGERAQRQHLKITRKFDQKHKDSNSSVSTPTQSLSPRKGDMANGVNRTKQTDNSSVGTSEDGDEQQPILVEEEDDNQVIMDMLSNVQVPMILEVKSRTALVQWQSPNIHSNKNLTIKETYFLYEILLRLNDHNRDGKYKIIFSGKSLSCRIRDLIPGTEYSLCLKVSMNDIKGTATQPVVFVTPSCEPDKPLPPKLMNRTRNSLLLRWTAPHDNGSPIQHYLLEYDEGRGDGHWVDICKTKAKQYSVPKLHSGSTYAFRLCAINSFGKSLYSDPLECTTVLMVKPFPPVLLEATSTSLKLSWQKRQSDEQFILERCGPENKNRFITVYSGPDSHRNCTQLIRASAYTFQLKVINNDVPSAWSDKVVFTTLPEHPSRPNRLQCKGKVKSTQLKLKWDPPNDNGGAPIKFYVLEMCENREYVQVYKGSELEAMCERLKPGRMYNFRVYCVNDGGQSLPSDVYSITTESNVPNAPKSPNCVSAPGPYETYLSWSQPDFNGGSEIIEYELEIDDRQCQSEESGIESNEGDRVDGDISAARLVYKGIDKQCVVKNLQPGETYTVRVRAGNRIGMGSWSDPFTFIAGAAIPDAPNSLEVIIRSATHLTINWEPPRSNGATIIEYRLDKSLSCDENTFVTCYQGVDTHAEIRQLLPATQYYFRLRAFNACGSSPYSSVSSITTPASCPAAPVINTYDITASQITVQWKEPENHGSPISQYNIDFYSDQFITTPGNVQKYTLTDLSAETLYKIRVQAINEIGTGPFSNLLKVITRPLAPKPPKLECILAGHTFLKLKWGDGKNTKFIKYHLEMFNNRTGDYNLIFSGRSFTHKVSKLMEQTVYTFRICSENDHGGRGEFSEDYEFTTSLATPNGIKAPRIYEQTANVLLPAASIQLEWQSSKNTFNDPIEYILQCTKSTEHNYKTLYRGPDTRYMINELNKDDEYLFRVCPVRITCDGDVNGSYSPTFRYTMVGKEIGGQKIEGENSNIITSPANLVQANSNVGVNGNIIEEMRANNGITRQYNEYGNLRKLIYQIRLICSDPSQANDQEKAILLAVVSIIITIGFTAILRMLMR